MSEFNWIAHYRDGTEAAQVDGAKYDQIDRPNLISFDLVNSDELIYKYDISPGSRFFYRRRGAQILMGAPTDQELHQYLVGAIGENYSIIKPDGTVLSGTDDPEINAFEYEVPCNVVTGN